MTIFTLKGLVIGLGVALLVQVLHYYNLGLTFGVWPSYLGWDDQRKLCELLKYLIPGALGLACAVRQYRPMIFGYTLGVIFGLMALFFIPHSLRVDCMLAGVQRGFFRSIRGREKELLELLATPKNQPMSTEVSSNFIDLRLHKLGSQVHLTTLKEGHCILFFVNCGFDLAIAPLKSVSNGRSVLHHTADPTWKCAPLNADYGVMWNDERLQSIASPGWALRGDRRE